MVLNAFRGALGFLSRLPVGHNEAGWDAFRAAPWTFPVTGYALGLLLAIPLLLPLWEPTSALLFILTVYIVTGINHLDGVADLGDAAVVHGTVSDRRAVLKDTTVGVGAVLAIVLVVIGLGIAGFSLAVQAANVLVLVLVIASEVGAKTATGVLVCVGTAPHEGLGSALTEASADRDAIAVLALAIPSILMGLAADALLATFAAVLIGLLTGAVVWRWARPSLGGVNGDVLGATIELARVAALHAGVVVWTGL